MRTIRRTIVFAAVLLFITLGNYTQASQIIRGAKIINGTIYLLYDQAPTQAQLQEDAAILHQMISIPTQDLWVNLSPWADETNLAPKDLRTKPLGTLLLTMDLLLKDIAKEILANQFESTSQQEEFSRLFLSLDRARIKTSFNTILVKEITYELQAEPDVPSIQGVVSILNRRTDGLLDRLGRLSVIASWFKTKPKTIGKTFFSQIPPAEIFWIYKNILHHDEIGGLCLFPNEIEEESLSPIEEKGTLHPFPDHLDPRIDLAPTIYRLILLLDTQIIDPETRLALLNKFLWQSTQESNKKKTSAPLIPSLIKILFSIDKDTTGDYLETPSRTIPLVEKSLSLMSSIDFEIDDPNFEVYIDYLIEYFPISFALALIKHQPLLKNQIPKTFSFFTNKLMHKLQTEEIEKILETHPEYIFKLIELSSTVYDVNLSKGLLSLSLSLAEKVNQQAQALWTTTLSFSPVHPLEKDYIPNLLKRYFSPYHRGKILSQPEQVTPFIKLAAYLYEKEAFDIVSREDLLAIVHYAVSTDLIAPLQTLKVATIYPKIFNNPIILASLSFTVMEAYPHLSAKEKTEVVKILIHLASSPRSKPRQNIARFIIRVLTQAEDQIKKDFTTRMFIQASLYPQAIPIIENFLRDLFSRKTTSKSEPDLLIYRALLLLGTTTPFLTKFQKLYHAYKEANLSPYPLIIALYLRLADILRNKPFSYKRIVSFVSELLSQIPRYSYEFSQYPLPTSLTGKQTIKHQLISVTAGLLEDLALWLTEKGGNPRLAEYLALASFRSSAIVSGDLNLKELLKVAQTPYFVEKTHSLPLSVRFSLIRGVVEELHRRGKPITEESVAEVVDNFLALRKKYMHYELMSPSREILFITEEDVNHKPWLDLLKQILQTPPKYEVLPIAKNTPPEKAEEMMNLLSAFLSSPGPKTLIFNVHGQKENIHIIYPQTMAYLLLETHLSKENEKYFVDMKETCLILDSCCSSDFVRKVLQEMYDIAQSEGIKIKSLPLIITSPSKGELAYQGLLPLALMKSAKPSSHRITYEDIERAEAMTQRASPILLKHMLKDRSQDLTVFFPTETPPSLTLTETITVQTGPEQSVITNTSLPQDLPIVAMIGKGSTTTTALLSSRHNINNSLKISLALDILHQKLELHRLERLNEELAQTEVFVFTENTVKSHSRYLLAFATNKNGKKGIYIYQPLLDNLSEQELAELLLHEALGLIQPETSPEDHKKRYNTIQREVFGPENTLKWKLRFTISQALIERELQRRTPHGAPLGILYHLNRICHCLPSIPKTELSAQDLTEAVLTLKSTNPFDPDEIEQLMPLLEEIVFYPSAIEEIIRSLPEETQITTQPKDLGGIEL